LGKGAGANPGRRAVLALRKQPKGDLSVRWIRMPQDPTRYGHDLYANLRALDACDCEVVVVEAPPDGLRWEESATGSPAPPRALG